LLFKAPRTRQGVIFHNQIENRIWVDSFYMCPPFLAAAGQPEEALKQIEGYRKILRDEQKRLYYHIWDEDLRRFERGLFWGVGNGWTSAGLARVIRALPERMSVDKARLAGYVRDLLDAALQYQRPDGLFHDILDDPNSFVETNAAQMFSYSMYRGVKEGWLDPAYRAQADRIREAVYARVDEFGLVQGVCGAPHFNRPGTATEGQAFFLLMEAAANELN